MYETRAAEDKARYMKELEEFQKTSNYAQLLEKRVKEHFGKQFLSSVGRCVHIHVHCLPMKY